MAQDQGPERPRRAVQRPARLADSALGEDDLESALGLDEQPAFSMGAVSSPGGSPRRSAKGRKARPRAAAKARQQRSPGSAPRSAAPAVLLKLLGIDAEDTVAVQRCLDVIDDLASSPGGEGGEEGGGEADGGGGSGGKKRKQGYMYTEEERAVLVGKVHGKLEDVTVKNYTSHLRKIEAFCELESVELSRCESPTEAAAVLGRSLDWFAQGMEGFDYVGKKEEQTLGLLRQVRNAAVYLYDALCTHKAWDSAPELRYHRCFTVELKSAKKVVQPKRARVKGDPQDNSATGVPTREEMMALARYFMSKGDLNATRNLCVIVMNAHGCGRFSDSTQFNLADIAKPVLLPRVGPCAALLYPFVLRGGKTTSAGQVELMCFLRHREPLMCGVRGMAWLLFYLYELEGGQIPDISTEEGILIFYAMVAFPANGVFNNLQFKELYDPMKKALLELGIGGPWVTHIGRVFCANQMQGAGVPAPETAGLGRWKGGQGGFQAMNSSYLMYPSPAALSAAAWYDMDAHTTPKEAFWHPRFCLPVPDALRRRVFARPLQQLRFGIAKLVAAGKKVPMAVASLVQALESYADVLVQDAVELCSSFPNDKVIRWCMAQPEFPPLLADYQNKLSAGAFRRPKNAQQEVQDVKRGFTAMARFLVSGGALAADLQQTVAAFEEDEQLHGVEAMLQHASIIAALERPARQAQARMAAGAAPVTDGAPAWEEAAGPDLLRQLADLAVAEGVPAAAPGARQQEQAGVAQPPPLPTASPQQQQEQTVVAQLPPLPVVAATQLTLQQPKSVAPVMAAWATAAVEGCNVVAAGLGDSLGQAQAAMQNAAGLDPGLRAVVLPLLSAMTQLVQVSSAAQQQQQHAIAALLATQGLTARPAGPPAGSLSAAAHGLLKGSTGMCSSEGGGSNGQGGSAGGQEGSASGAGVGGGSGSGSAASAGQQSTAVECNLPRQLHLLGSTARLAQLYYNGEGVYPAWQQQEADHGTGWRPGKQRRKVWSKIKVGVELIDALAEARTITPAQAALEWDAVLGGTKTRTGVATMCRKEEHGKLLAMVGL